MILTKEKAFEFSRRYRLKSDAVKAVKLLKVCGVCWVVMNGKRTDWKVEGTTLAKEFSKFVSVEAELNMQGKMVHK